MIALQDRPIDVQSVIAAVAGPDRGGIAVFLGTVRDHHRGREVHALGYHAYDGMAEKELRAVVEKVESECVGARVAVVHRTGDLDIGDIAVVVAASAAHRAAAFDACRLTIDRLKETVPIWKKETFADGEEWIEEGG